MLRVLIAIAVLGCGTKSTPPAPPQPPPPPVDAAIVVDVPPPAPLGPLDRDMPRLAERSLKLYESVVETFRTAGADCAAATAKLNALRTEFADVTTANAKVLHEGRGRELKAALAKYDDKLDAAAREIVGSQTMSKCSSDRAFTRAFDELVGAPP